MYTGMPAWTIARTSKELEDIALLAGFSSAAVLGDLHLFRSSDPRTTEITEGLSPMQVSLDQAAHLMDAVAFGKVEGGWEVAKISLAEKYRIGGYPKIAEFILS